MRGVIKGVLAEELRNSRRMKVRYEAELRRLPKGCIVAKKIKGHRYYYLVQRDGGHVRYAYKGIMTDGELRKYREAKLYRAKYRKLLSQVKKQIKFLRSSLRGKEAI